MENFPSGSLLDPEGAQGSLAIGSNELSMR